MFTGIVEQTGQITEIQENQGIRKLKIEAGPFLDDLKIGDSISINGVCLTAVSINATTFDVQVVDETKKVTSFDRVQVGAKVNLEKALSVGGKLDGHLVQGHVDGLGSLIDQKQEDDNLLIGIQVPEDLMVYIIPKGSVAVEGISLTVQSIEENRFYVAIIPHTYQNTNLKEKKVGDPLNIEVDFLGKYVVNYLKRSNQNAGRK